MAGIVSDLRPAGGKPHGCRCGQGVGEMPVPTCQLTRLFTPVTTVSVGGWAETKRSIMNQPYRQMQNRSNSLLPLWTEQALLIVIY